MIKYQLEWHDENAVNIEMMMIRAGGYLTIGGVKCGQGLFHHYKALQLLLWPDDEDHHRWSDRILQEILNNRITVLAGARDTGKTHCMARYALTDYFVFPHNTLILISSTDTRGLQLRIFGDIKDLLARAKERFPWLPGHAVESNLAIFTDKLDFKKKLTIRDMRKGIICVPCVGGEGEQLEGLEKFIGVKQQRRRLLGDECFVAGTMIATPEGLKPIERIKTGTFVYNALGQGLVTGVLERDPALMCEIRLRSGRVIHCTPSHRFFTMFGWKKACELNVEHFILATHEAMRLVQEPIYSEDEDAAVLQRALSAELSARDADTARVCLYRSAQTYAHRQSDAQSAFLQKGGSYYQTFRSAPHHPWGQWNWTDEGGIPTYENVSRGSMELRDQNGKVEWLRVSPGLQSRPRLSRNQTCARGRWRYPQHSIEESEGLKKGQVFEGDWVDSVEILQPNDPRLPHPGSNPSRCRVYNLQVEGHPSYSVEGLLVHNCQFMDASYLNTLSNLDKGDFKGAFAGNFLGRGDPLDQLAEPKEGWAKIGEPKKTVDWDNLKGGRTLNLVGSDSPNFDYPQDQPSRYPYLIDRHDIERVKLRYGEDSLQFWSQIKGIRKSDLMAHRVLTVDLCRKFGAFASVFWESTDITKIYSMDAAFGGDRPVHGHIEFGRDVNGRWVIKCFRPSSVKLRISDVLTVEEQLATEMKTYCALNGIPATNCYYDAGMRATLAVTIGRVFSTQCNAINFGGVATDRPVSSDDYVYDEKDKRRRLKRCNEAYSKFVTELNYSVRMVVEAGQMRDIPEEVVREFELREWYKVTGDRIELETKAETKRRMGYSPDLADWLAIAVEGARRRGFIIEGIKDPSLQSDVEDLDWLSRELSKFKTFVKKHQITYNQ